MSHDRGEMQPSRKDLRALVEACRITSGDAVRLDRYPTGHPAPDLVDKASARDVLKRGIADLSRMQEALYADARWSLLLVFQAMDAAGKDSTIKHVMTGVNPQGVSVTSFKQPGPEDLAHDFLWRTHRHTPARGMIGIFNRSHYEEVLVARVHPDILAAQRLPPGIVEGRHLWDDRLEDIAAFERHLGRQGTRIIKFFLHVGRDEQKSRFLDRLDEPDKTWKFNPGDLRDRERWDDYMAAYEAAIAGTATKAAPWYVVPADHKWLMRLIVVEAVNEALRDLDLKPPLVSPDMQAELDAARASLAAEG